MKKFEYTEEMKNLYSTKISYLRDVVELERLHVIQLELQVRKQRALSELIEHGKNSKEVQDNEVSTD